MTNLSIHVLLVEDNPIDALLLEETLAQMNLAQFRVSQAERLAEAAERLKQEAFDVTLVDLGLPDSQGLETLVKIRKLAPHTPIVVLTGLADETLGLKALQAGAQDYLVKGQVDGYNLARAIRYAIERQQAEATLAMERQRLRTLIDNLPDHVYLKDTEGRFITGNLAVARAMGVNTPAQLIGKTDFDFYPPEVAGQYVASEQMVIRSGQPVIDHEEPLVSADGRRGWLLTTQVPLRDDKGQVAGLVGISRDITERKQIEAEIRRRNIELTLLNQVAAACAAESDEERLLELTCRELAVAFRAPHTTATLLNPQKTLAMVAAEYRDKSHPSVLGSSVPIPQSVPIQQALIHESPLAITECQSDMRLAPFHELLHQLGVVSLLILPLRMGGEVIGALSLEFFEPRHFAGEEINLAWSVADQVAGALARIRLTQMQQRLSTAIEQAAESVIITDTSGIISYVNPAFERISGYSRLEVVGLTPRILKSGHHEADFYREMWATISAGQVWRGRIINKRKDGALYTEDTTITPVYNENGTIINHVSVQRDVTRELQLEEQYHQAQKMEAMGRLSGGVAHDFNNLLVVIIGYSELLEGFLEESDSLRHYAREILAAGERAAGLTQQLLAFSRKQVLQPKILNLNEVVTNIEKMLHRLIGEDIDLFTITDPNLGQVKIDPGQMEQIIVNLVVNARDAMPRGGKIILETANVQLDEIYTREHVEVQPGPYVLLAVSDTGVGMDAVTQAHIFEPFFTTKGPGKGTGLGLATVYGIIKQSDGDIWVYSEPGQGTTFKIYLPRIDKVEADAAESRDRLALQGGAETILLVEDEANVRALARQVLERGGYTVLEASDAKAALGLREQHSNTIHLLLTDIIMPGGMNGRELAVQLKADSPELKVLFMSGYTDDAIVHHGILEAGLMFMQKPFTPRNLMRKVREVLDMP